MIVHVATDGRWSGGGAAMLRNFETAAALYPDSFTTERELSSAQIIPRNVPVDFPATRRPYLLAPQNAWPWHPGRPTGAEAWHVLRLRVASELAIRRSSGMLRISSAIPPGAGRPCSPVLHNVLDEDFDVALRDSESGDRLDLADAIVMIGSLSSYRNVGRLLAAHAGYRARGGKLRLMVCGPAGTSSQMRRLTAIAGESSAVSLQVGSVARPQALRLMRDAAGVVLPSLVEASPLTALESAAVSQNVLLSDIVGHREILEQLGSAHEDAFFEPHDVASLTRGLHRLQDGLELGVGPALASAEVRREHRADWSKSLVSWLSAGPFHAPLRERAGR